MKNKSKQLPTDIDTLHALLLEKDNEIGKLQSKLDSLIEQLRLARHQRFGTSSEKQNPQQGELFDEAESLVEEEDALQTDVVTIPGYERKKAGRKPLPAHLPRIEVVHDLADDEKVCAYDGHALHKIGEEISEQLEIIPATIRVIKNIRIKYGCRACEQGIKTASMPKQAIPKSNATPGLLAYVAISKYQDALPLYRQENIFKRHGIDIPRATLANWMIKVGTLFIPLVNLMRDYLVSHRLIHYDETRYQVLNEPGKTAQSLSYMWVGVAGAIGQRVILFDYSPSRAGHVPVQLLDGFDGYLVTDDYSGYNAACKKGNITRVGCWAHARRKFDEALKVQKKKSGKAQVAINYIAKLYRIETSINALPAEQKQQARQDKSSPIIEEMQVWLETSLTQVNVTSKLGIALRYLNNNWVRLTRFLEDGIIPLDNNAAENAIRPFVVGRKNWLHSNSVKGANASAAIYSMIETAKANELEPYAYLSYIIKELPLVETIEQFESLLPWNVNNEHLAYWH
ncbi:MAG: IS66 family transposase [Psychromonas sp.]